MDAAFADQPPQDADANPQTDPGATHAPAVPAVEALRAALRIETVADGSSQATRRFERLHEVLAAHFPLLHQGLDRHRIGESGLLWHWRSEQGEPSEQGGQRPLVLMAHQDVVPVAEPERWQHPPFAGDVVDGVIWGRGTLDDKGSLVAICSAVEELLATGFVPRQDVWLSFGADEEVAGECAPLAVDFLRGRGVTPWLVLDEGGAVAGDALPGVSSPVAVVGVAEKGSTILRISAAGEGGHASTPVRGGPAARLAGAISRLERPGFTPRLLPPTRELLERIIPALPVRLQPVVAAAAKTGQALARLLTLAGPEARAMVQTTVAVTTLSGAPAANVIPAAASAELNVRILPGESVSSAVARVRRRLRGLDVTVEVVEAGEPSPVSPSGEDPGFALLERLIREHFPAAIPTPYLVMAGTDARYFHAICERVYRFAPLAMSRQQRATIHGHDEHLAVTDYLAGVAWYADLIREVA